MRMTVPHAMDMDQARAVAWHIDHLPRLCKTNCQACRLELGKGLTSASTPGSESCESTWITGGTCTMSCSGEPIVMLHDSNQCVTAICALQMSRWVFNSDCPLPRLDPSQDQEGCLDCMYCMHTAGARPLAPGLQPEEVGSHLRLGLLLPPATLAAEPPFTWRDAHVQRTEAERGGTMNSPHPRVTVYQSKRATYRV